MAVRVEGYDPGKEIPGSNHFIEGNGTYIIYPKLDSVDVNETFEAIIINPRAKNLGINATVFILSPDKVDINLMKFNDDYKGDVSRRLANEEQKLTDTKIELNISPGEAIQYKLLHNRGDVVIWHDTGQDYDLSAFLLPPTNPAIM